MLTGWTPAAAGGPCQSAETGIARAETLGPDGCQRTWKPGPGGAEGPTDAKESSHSLFPSGMLKPEKGAGSRGGGPRGMGEEVGRPDAGARHATQPAPGTAAGGRAITGEASTMQQHGMLADNKDPRLGRGQDNGELSDVAQKYGTTPGTASAVFPRLGYAMADGANINSQPVPANTKIESKASTLSRQGTGELGNMAERLGTTLGTASAILNRLGYDTDAPERDTSPKQGEKDSWYTVSGVAIDKQRGSPLDMTQPVVILSCQERRSEGR